MFNNNNIALLRTYNVDVLVVMFTFLTHLLSYNLCKVRIEINIEKIFKIMYKINLIQRKKKKKKWHQYLYLKI